MQDGAAGSALQAAHNILHAGVKTAWAGVVHSQIMVPEGVSMPS